MKALMIPSFFRDKYNPSSGSFFVDQAIALQNAGCEVDIIYPDTYSIIHFNDYIHYNEHDEIYNGINVMRGKKLSPFKYKSILGCKRDFALGCQRILSNCEEKFDYDIIHAQNAMWAGYSANLLSKKYAVPYIVTEHSSFYDLGKSWLVNCVRQDVSKIYRESSAAVCVSSGLKQTLKALFVDTEFLVIGNVVDTELYHINECREKRHENICFISVAFLSTEERIDAKGIHSLLLAFAKFKENDKVSALKIVGVPENNVTLREEIIQLHLDHDVELVGPSDRKTVSKLMMDADCFILPSKYETFGLVYAEAMSAGKPVIATKVGIADEIIDSSTGIVCKRDSTSLCKSMQYIKERIQEGYFDSQTIRNKIVSQFSEAKIAEQILDIYKNVIRRWEKNNESKKENF